MTSLKIFSGSKRFVKSGAIHAITSTREVAKRVNSILSLHSGVAFHFGLVVTSRHVSINIQEIPTINEEFHRVHFYPITYFHTYLLCFILYLDNY